MTEIGEKVTVRVPLVPRLHDGTPAVVLMPGAHACFLSNGSVVLFVGGDGDRIVSRETGGCDA